ncbi:MAG: sulfite exporter TauE/SafE family protein [Acidobacteriota bacterium]
MIFLILVAVAAAFTGAMASVSAVGIGTILIPIVAWHYDIKIAIAAMSIPHAAAMVLRMFRLWRSLDARVLLGFGVMNTAGALAGALLQSMANTRSLGTLLGVILVTVGGAGLFGWTERVLLTRFWAWVAGAVSGIFGGLVGSQGPLRSAAMLALGIRKEAFVATATAMGLAVDGVRMPVYFAAQGSRLLDAWPAIVTSTAAVLVGTLLGERVLHRIPERAFARVVSGIIGALGVMMLARSL